MIGMRLLMFLKIDDEVGAISAHMGAGVWGTLAACIAAGADVVVQMIGIVAIGAFAFGVSLLTWKVIDWTIGTFGEQLSVLVTLGKLATPKPIAGLSPFR